MGIIMEPRPILGMTIERAEAPRQIFIANIRLRALSFDALVKKILAILGVWAKMLKVGVRKALDYSRLSFDDKAP